MSIVKGELHARLWRILQQSLKWEGNFPRAGIGGSVASFLNLQSEPAAAVESVLHGKKWHQAELYSVVIGKTKHILVFGSNSRRSDKKELVYPEQVSPAVERAIILNALIASQWTAWGLLWRQEGGFVFLVFYPLFGLFVAWFGWMLGQTVMVDSPAPELARWITLGMSAVGVGLMVFPTAYAFRLCYTLRSALEKHSLKEIEEYLESLKKPAPGLAG